MLDRRLSAGLLPDALVSRPRKLRDFLQDRGADLLDPFMRPQHQEREPDGLDSSQRGCMSSIELDGFIDKKAISRFDD